MTTAVTQVPVKNESRTVTVAASPVYIMMGAHSVPASITAVPGGGGTLAIAYSTSPIALTTPASATWIAWPAGTVSTGTSQTLLSPVVALRATAATATGTVEISS